MVPSGWSFLSHHGMVLVALARQTDLRLSELGAEVGISPRAAQSIVTDLVRDGYLERRRIGRRNSYRLRGERRVPDPWAQDRQMGELVRAIARGRGAPRPSEDMQHALVLACSDYRYQDGLRDLLGSLGLSAHAEMVLWPGGSAALTEPGGTVLLELIAAAVERDPPSRFVLVSHERCHVGEMRDAPADPLAVVAEATPDGGAGGGRLRDLAGTLVPDRSRRSEDGRTTAATRTGSRGVTSAPSRDAPTIGGTR
jgi:hypothetical protein